MRAPSKNDFPVQVEGIGTFTFARRTLNDEVKIQVQYARLTEGVETPTPWLFHFATWLATLKVLMVAAPDGFDLEALDPLDENTYTTLEKVFRALREQEDRFRGKSGEGRQGAGAPAGEDDRVLVPAEVQPAAE